MGNDVRHIAIFDAYPKLLVKQADFTQPIFHPDDSDYGGVKQRSREEAIILFSQ